MLFLRNLVFVVFVTYTNFLGEDVLLGMGLSGDRIERIVGFGNFVPCIAPGGEHVTTLRCYSLIFAKAVTGDDSTVVVRTIERTTY